MLIGTPVFELIDGITKMGGNQNFSLPKTITNVGAETSELLSTDINILQINGLPEFSKLAADILYNGNSCGHGAQCATCGLTHQTDILPLQMVDLMIKYHSTAETYSCSNCGFDFSTKEAQLVHTRICVKLNSLLSVQCTKLAHFITGPFSTSTSSKKIDFEPVSVVIKSHSYGQDVDGVNLNELDTDIWLNSNIIDTFKKKMIYYDSDFKNTAKDEVLDVFRIIANLRVLMKKELRTQAIFDEEHCKVWEDQMNEPSDKEFGESTDEVLSYLIMAISNSNDQRHVH
ncbi:hypothetical protein TYRP_018574 [Tyrophagus putrescentiae]|nr:hypothetical protein TYRP_018574 [Tyrophagus putrescentiae]